MSIFKSKIAFLAVCLASALPAQAATVDIDNVFRTSGGVSVDDFILAQTFTAGATGHLTQVDLQLYSLRSPDLTYLNSGALISIVTTTSGLPDYEWDNVNRTPIENPLGSLQVAADSFDVSPFDVSSTGAATSFDLSAENIILSAGVQYAIVVRQTDDTRGPLFWGTHNGERDADGNLLGTYDGGSIAILSTVSRDPRFVMTGASDFGFRTYLEPAIVPLPAGLPLIGSALVALGLVGRRRRRVVHGANDLA